MSVLEVKFVGDGDVLEHIVDKQEGVQSSAGSVQRMVKFKSPPGRKGCREDGQQDEEENGVFDQQNYIQALGTDNIEEDEESWSRVAGSSIFTFQKVKRGNSMAHTGESCQFPLTFVLFQCFSSAGCITCHIGHFLLFVWFVDAASELARTPRKNVSFSSAEPCTPTRTGRNHKGENRTPQKSKKVQFVSTTPHRLRKRLTAPSLRSDSDSELSPSDSGEEEEEEEDKLKEKQKVNKEDKENQKNQRTASKGLSAALYKTPTKKSKNTAEPVNQPTMTEEYFEAHASSKVLTSDRTLERLHTPKLDRETLAHLLEGKPSCYSKEIQELHNKHRKHFTKWMLQLHRDWEDGWIQRPAGPL
ncbi:hypothetical protein ATANTOWER_014943 [Ataeniobius toweri]|uniref:Origin recognition complex subunit 2 n=1 Tax=Ataeniobius toweri TaxID=208326 RepID=A0ABU7BYP0_9TELE|nr:hypothetical protein [Ataeniobius toweri]